MLVDIDSPRLKPDLILWNDFFESPEILRDFCISENVDTSIRNSIISVIESNWDSFCERGVPRPVLDFEFCIDTCNTTLICCHQPNYGFHERNIVNQLITALVDSGLITDCEGSRGSILLIDVKPRQEDCTNINPFIWMLCVSYRPLNSITRSFEYPIPHCVDSIDDISDSRGSLTMISLDICSEYHQVKVRQYIQDKLDFSILCDKRERLKS